MKRLLFLCFWLCAFCSRAAVPTFQSFEPTQFDTNNFRVAYRDPWTNDVGIVYQALPNDLTLITNLNSYGTFSLPAKVTLLTLGTNYLDLSTNSTWLLNSPTNDAAQVILSLSAGAYQGQLLFITSQNGGNSFTLPDLSEQWDVPGAYVDIQGDWVGTTNRGIILQYTAPDWIEMARFDPGGGAPGSINPTDGVMPVRANATTFVDSSIRNPDVNGAEIFNRLNQQAYLNILSLNTNNAANFIAFKVTDSDNSGEVVFLNGSKSVGWDVGNPSIRNGTFSINVQTAGSWPERFEINGSSGLINFFDNAGVQNFAVNNDGSILVRGSQTNVISTDGVYLTYTNTSPSPGIKVFGNGTTTPAIFGQTPGALGVTAQISGPKGVVFGWDVALAEFSSTNLIPSVPINLGTASFPFYKVFLAATTNQVTFGATNTAPASAVAPTKWISVTVSGDAGVYRVPLYE